MYMYVNLQHQFEYIRKYLVAVSLLKTGETAKYIQDKNSKRSGK